MYSAARGFLLDKCEELVEELLQQPDKFQKPEYRFLHRFILTVESNPSKYPIYDSQPRLSSSVGRTTANSTEQRSSISSSEEAAATANIEQLRNRLTKKYAQSIVDFKPNEHTRPVLQVIDKEDNSFRSGQLHHKQKERIVSVSLVDGSNDRLLGKLSTAATDSASQLTTGAVIQLNTFTPVSHYHKNNFRAGVLIVNFTVLGHCELLCRRDRISTCYIEAAEVEEVPTSESVATVDIGEDYEPVPLPSSLCSEDRRLCTMAGVKMHACICECNPVQSVPLDVVARSCYFVNSSVSDMENNQKRNILYWYYATNIYGFRGQTVRKLPECLEFAIRRLYPNKRGKKYVGCKESG